MNRAWENGKTDCHPVFDRSLNPVYEPGVGKQEIDYGNNNVYPVLIPFMNRAWGNETDKFLAEIFAKS